MIPNIREFLCGSSLRCGCYVISIILVVLGVSSVLAGFSLQDDKSEYDNGYLKFSEAWCRSKIVGGGLLVVSAVLIAFGTFLGNPKAQFLKAGALLLLFSQLLLLFFYIGYYVNRERYHELFFSVTSFALFTYCTAVVWSYGKELRGEFR